MTLREELNWLWHRPGTAAGAGLLLGFCVIKPAIDSIRAGRVFYTDPTVWGSAIVGVVVFAIAVSLARAFRGYRRRPSKGRYP